MLKEKTVTKSRGLHTEDCAVIAQIAGRFQSDIFLIRDNKRVNAKSIMGLISLNVKKGDTIYLSVSGNDEKAAFDKLFPLL